MLHRAVLNRLRDEMARRGAAPMARAISTLGPASSALTCRQVARGQSRLVAEGLVRAAGVAGARTASNNAEAAMLWQVQEQARAGAAEIVPWFLANMPDEYFMNVPEEVQIRHIRAISALQMREETTHKEVVMTDLDSKGEGEVTIFVPLDQPGQLLHMLESLSGVTEAQLAAVQTYTSLDKSMGIDVFQFGEDHAHVSNSNRMQDLAATLEGEELVAVDVEHMANGRTKLRVAAPNVWPKLALQRVSAYVAFKGLNVEQVKLSVVPDAADPKSTVTMMSLRLEAMQEVDWDQIQKELPRVVKFLDDAVLQMLIANPAYSIDHHEVINALCNLLHAKMAGSDRFAFARPRIFEIVTSKSHLKIAAAISELLMRRHDPEAPMGDTEFASRCEEVRAEIRRNVETDDAAEMLNTMLDAVKATLRTNLHLPGRLALALRLDSAFLKHGNAVVGTDVPFGIFFVHGRGFNGFHVRFREIARGGLRVVTPPTPEQHEVESARQYDETYSLAFAQQLKNKDIPEGGAKAVCLVEPLRHIDEVNESFVIRTRVKAFADALLDLCPSKDSSPVRPGVLDLGGHLPPDLLYLGPDEQIIPDDISWIVERAGKRDHPFPSAFISSKPDAGINHKEFGVTSEGVAVFLDVALHEVGHRPRERPFTVKMTGGPDGDVAGNMLSILHREYGSNARVVGICDGSGTAEDPDGLDMDELLRLVGLSAPIAKFDQSKLGPSGRVMGVDTEKGVRVRNTMPFRVQADAFIPAGGRPATINAKNFHKFINGDGTPSSPLIVEGANLFITPEARVKLFEDAGVVVVKDSSANKCGVICSSYEIMASMMLSKDEFLGIKPDLVEDVVRKLRHLARVEAELLFREQAADPGSSMPATSVRISRSITRMHDAVVGALDGIAGGGAQWGLSESELAAGLAGLGLGTNAGVDMKMLMGLVKEWHLPEKLQEFDHRLEGVPWAYVKNIIACSLSSRLVYQEGLAYVDSIPDAQLPAVALRYVAEDRKVRELIQALQGSGELDQRARGRAAELLVRGGVRSALSAACK